MHFGKARREGQGWLSLTSGATLSKGHQRPALRGFASKLPAALQTFERQPAFLHDCAFRAVSAQSLRHHLIDQRCLNLSDPLTGLLFALVLRRFYRSPIAGGTSVGRALFCDSYPARTGPCFFRDHVATH